MMALCNTVHPRAGLDLADPDPDAGFIVDEVECGKPARYGDRLYAGSDMQGTLFCEDCFALLDRDLQIDIVPLKPEVTQQTGDSKKEGA